MKRNYFFVFMTILLLVSCSTEDRTNDYVAGSKLILNATLPNSGTRVSEAASDTYGLVTNWSDDDSLDVLVNTSTVVSMTKSAGNTFTSTTDNSTIASGFNVGSVIYGVSNKYNDKITTASNGNQLKATIDFTGQDGTISNLAKYDMVYGKGDPTGSVMFNHKICVLRLDINSDLLKTDGITSLTGLKLNYVATSTSDPQLFATQEVFNFGSTCDSTVTDADNICLNNTKITVTDGTASVYIAVPCRQNLSGKLYIHLKGSNGTISNSYDLTNPISLSNKSFALSTVQSKTISNLSKTIVKVGDYLFSDGSWGPSDILDSAIPIAVIFSATTSATDQTYGWTHGYAMALKNASSSVAWAETEETDNPTKVTLVTSVEMKADKDGYTHTQLINTSSYPAAYYAVNYKSTVAAPSNTSGWYLPSIGQWYDICVNLGKLTTTDAYEDDGSIYWESLVASSNINAYLTPLTSDTYDTFPVGEIAVFYWSSSEYSSTGAYVAVFNNLGGMFLGNSDKSNAYRARGVIAF